MNTKLIMWKLLTLNLKANKPNVSHLITQYNYI